MARSRRGSFQVGTTTRRRTAWADGTGGTAITTITSVTPSFVGSSVVPAVEGLTIVRIRGYFRAIQTSKTTAGDGFRFAFGIGLATFAAVTAGIASVPTPLAEQDSENWLFWHAGRVQAITGTEADGANAFGIVFDFEIDSKAMRRFPGESALYAAIEQVETGTATMEVSHDSRLLVKLP